MAASLFLADGARAPSTKDSSITLAAGIVLWLVSRGHARDLQIKDGFILVVLTWTLLPAFATLPLLVYFRPELSFTDAYFEAVSGLTTTGATILQGLDKLP